MPSVNRNAQDRKLAYIQAMEKAGSEPLIIPTPSQNWAFEAAGFEQATAYFSMKALPSRTILCANDRTAFGVMAAANHCGLRVSRAGGPNEIRVAGHDDHPLSRFASPPLTTLAQNYVEMANLAVDLLAARGRALVRRRVEIFDCSRQSLLCGTPREQDRRRLHRHKDERLRVLERPKSRSTQGDCEAIVGPTPRKTTSAPSSRREEPPAEPSATRAATPATSCSAQPKPA